MKGPKTLYVSDLDGTLLRHDQTVSPFTAETINTLTARGMLFSYATARSLVTAKTVTKGLNTHFPLIIYNGAFVRDNVTEEILLANYFDASVYAVLDELFKANIYPIVYANVDGREHFSFIYEKCTPGLKGFAAGVLGGFGYMPGCIAGGLVLGIVENIASMILPSVYKDVVAFVLLVAFLLFRPQGLLGKKNK